MTGLWLVAVWVQSPFAEDSLLVDAYPLEGDEQHEVLEISFSGELRHVSHQQLDAGMGLLVKLRDLKANSRRAWESKDILLDGVAGVNQVSLEGNSIKGYTLSVQVQPGLMVKYKSQVDSSHIEVEITPQKDLLSNLKIYAINLESRKESLDELPVHEPLPEGYSLYSVAFGSGVTRFNRVRLGFFVSLSEANRLATQLRSQFPGAWVSQVSVAEENAAKEKPLLAVLIPPDAEPSAQTNSAQKQVIDSAIAVASAETLDATAATSATRQPTIAPKTRPQTVVGSDHELLSRALAAATAKDYATAIRFYTKALESDDTAVRKQALEQLAVAREYNGQAAHAKALYEKFLMEYPDSPEQRRVQQRLSGLITRNLPMKKKLNQAQEKDDAWSLFGNVSQFYRRHALTVEGSDEVVGIDALFSDVDVIAKRQGQHMDLGMRFSGSYALDFAEASRQRSFQASSIFLEGSLNDYHLDFRMGRQSKTNAGVLGRFDGLLLEYQVLPWLEINSVAGYLVNSSFDTPNTDRPFYGVSAEFSLWDGALEWMPFFVEQQASGLLDRRAVGMESRYYSEKISAFSLLDYDIYHGELNNLYLQGNFRLPRDYQIHGSYDHRRSPYLTTQNALIGQGVEDLSELERDFAVREIQQLAEDRTSEVDLLNFGIDKKLTSRYQVTLDVSISDYSGTETSGDVQGFEGRTYYYYSAQLRANDMYGDNSYSSLQLRYSDSGTTQSNSIYWNNRFALGEGWRVYPRLRVDYKTFDTSGQQEWHAAPSVRVDYRRRRGLTFEFESGYDWSNRQLQEGDLGITGYFLRAGYRYIF